MNASEIAALVGGTLAGTANPRLDGVEPLDRAGPGELSFLAHPRYLRYLADTRAGAVLVARSLAERAADGPPHIVVDDVHAALAVVLSHFNPEPEREPGIHPTAVIGPESELGVGVSIGPCCVVGGRVRLGDGVQLGAHVVVGDGCVLDDEVVLHPHVVLYRDVRIGARSIVHAGTRIGVDGFGYVAGQDGHRKIPQVGGCVVGTDVEIGANVTIDRGSIGITEIGDGVKIDNLVQIGHNVRIGAGSIVVALVGIAGSTDIGRHVTIGGQAGLNGHIRIGDGATIAAQAGVFGDVPAGAVYSGYPARPHRESLKAHASVSRLTRLTERVRALERMVFRGEGRDDA